MPTGNVLDIQLAHDEWATRQILLACQKLSLEQLNRPFEMGLGSLYKTMLHVISAQRGWTSVLAGQDRPPPLTGEFPIEQLLTMHGEVSAAFARGARGGPMEALVVAKRDGKTATFTRAGVVTHVTTHGMHHRAQALNMLRHLGVTPLPLSSVLEWMLNVDGVTLG